MKKTFRILAIAALLLIGLALAALFLGRQRLYSRPDWYRASGLTAEQRAAAANSADQKLIATRSQIAQAYAAQVRAARAGSSGTTQPASQFTLGLSEDEVNSWLPKWERQLGVTSKSESYIKDPVIVFRDQQIIVAADVKKWNSIVSLHFSPTVKDGKLNVDLVQVTAGTLPLPRASWDGYVQKLKDALKAKLPALQGQADIDATGRANPAAVETAMSELLLDTLNNSPSEAVMFLPDQLGRTKSLPVRINDVTVSDHALTLTVEAMNEQQRLALIEHLRGPLPVASASNP